MAASTERTLSEKMRIENKGQPGVFSVISRDTTQAIDVAYGGLSGAETVELIRAGDGMTLGLLGVDWIEISAATYPTKIVLLLSNTGDLSITAAPYISAVSGGLTAVHKDLTVSGAGATTAIWTPATGSRAIITSVFVSTDTGMRVAVVDNADTAGNRIMVAPALPAGGSLARFFGDPDGYISNAVNNVIKLVTGAAGTTFVSLDGFERVG